MGFLKFIFIVSDSSSLFPNGSSPGCSQLSITFVRVGRAASQPGQLSAGALMQGV
jgi:hypothetical protein